MALYVISTPIGNRADMTKRALQTLGFCQTVLCEDTRKTNQLLDFYQLQPKPKLIPFFEGGEEERINQVLTWLREGQEVGLVSNAGTPTISDPGFKLVRQCRREGIVVKSVPGPTAVMAALSISGLPTDKFCFLGFLPKSKGKKKKIFRSCKKSSLSPTFIFYESPYRLEKSLQLMSEIFSAKTTVAIAREMTKIHEEVIDGSLAEVLQKVKNQKIKGEVTVVFGVD